MLDTKRIPIGKLKQDSALSTLEAEELIAVLWPNGVFPYALWEKVYSSHWHLVARHNTVFHLAGAPPTLPEIPPSEYEITGLYHYRRLISDFFKELSIKIFVADLKPGFQYILEEVYGNNSDNFKDSMENLFDKLSTIEDKYDLRIFHPFIWATNLTNERSKQLMDEKMQSVPSSCYSFISEMFIDTIVVDKAAARHLIDNGYTWREVSGISKTSEECIMATPAIHSQDNAPIQAPTPTIIVSRVLWEGKSPQAVRDGMREAGFDDPIIAHVLFAWREETKVKIGRLLGVMFQ